MNMIILNVEPALRFEQTQCGSYKAKERLGKNTIVTVH